MVPELDELTQCSLDAGGYVRGDRPCIRCGYNLRGLPATGTCSECGGQVRATLTGRYLIDAGPPWLRHLKYGALMVFAGGMTLLLAPLVFTIITGELFVEWFVRSAGSMPAALAAALSVAFGLIVIGVLRIGTSDPGAQAIPEGLSARRLVRGFAVLLPLIPVLLIAYARSTPWTATHTALGAAAALGLVLVPAGLTVALFRYLEQLCRRVPDVGLAEFCRAIQWLTAVVAAPSIACWPAYSSLFGFTAAALVGLCALVVLAFVYRVLSNTARRAVTNAKLRRPGNSPEGLDDTGEN